MDSQSFEDRKGRLFNFMDEVNAQRQKEQSMKAFTNRPEVKLRRLEQTKKDGVEKCLNCVFGSLYNKSLPTNDLLPQSTCINGSIQRLQNPSELHQQMQDFIQARSSGNGATYYVTEAIRRTNSPALKRLMEGVTNIVNEQYHEKTRNPESITDDDFKFKLTGESEEKLNDLMNSLQMDDLSDIIKQNVKTTVINEVEAAKKEKEERDALENDLANDETMTSESAIDNYLLSHNLSKKDVFYQPSLFEGIMMSHFNNLPYQENATVDPIDNVEILLEGAGEKIRRLFMNKETKELLDDFKTYQGAYARMLGMYESDVKTNDHKQIVYNCQEALKSSRISPKCTFTLPDVATVEKELDEVKKAHEAVLSNPTQSKGNGKTVSTSKKDYSIKDAIMQYNASVKFLTSYFKNGDNTDATVKEYQKLEETALKKCKTKRDEKHVHDAVSGLLVVETTRVMLHIQYVKAVRQVSKKITAEADRMTAKESAFDESVKELTMLNCVKALRLEEFPLTVVREMAKDYARK